MSKIDTVGPAFPSINPTMTGIDSDGFERWESEPCGGMTLRDYFAAKALQGELAGQYEGNNWFQPEKLAEYVYQIADAMIKERSK